VLRRRCMVGPRALAQTAQARRQLAQASISLPQQLRQAFAFGCAHKPRVGLQVICAQGRHALASGALPGTCSTPWC
jgi:hypothetical protein